MTGFLIAAACGIALVLMLLLRPFIWKPAGTVSHRQLNTRIYRDQFERLEQDLRHGMLSPEDLARARAEVQRRLLEETRDEDALAAYRSPRKTIVGIALALPLAAAALYALVGNPASLGQGGHSPGGGDLDVERMVIGLAQKLEKDPGNLKGWAMLARSYKVMGRGADAERAFERAGSFIDGDAVMLANYADVAAANAGGRFAGKPDELISKALKADPNNAMALWLAGTAALDRKDYAGAIATWERLSPQLPPGSEDARMLQGAIDEVRLKAGIGRAGATSVSGTVALDPSLQDRLKPGDTLMVIARAPGSRMPLAVVRVPANRFPFDYKLDDSMAMSPQALLSTATQVEVEARVSKSGQARAEPGDLVSPAQTVKVGARGVALNVSEVRR
ncbi:MAG TPA: c-type cytochrome biogenesis protein CcmI [Ramlibacter sp.]|nr:c-type cytochrome biogenesis protein CcmI [Ramlibacter sp.]